MGAGEEKELRRAMTKEMLPLRSSLSRTAAGAEYGLAVGEVRD